MNFSSSISNLKGVGEKNQELLRRLKIKTVEDLIWHLPRRYDDYSVVSTIDNLQPGPVTIKASFKQVNGRYVRRGLHITEAVASDESGSVRVVWFNQPYRAKALKQTKKYFVSGNFEFSNRQYVISNPACELVSDFPKNSARIVPVYKETKGLTSHQIRKLIAQCIDMLADVPEELPATVVSEANLPALSWALQNIHFPQDSTALETAKRRLAFDELFSVLLANHELRTENSKNHAPKITFDKRVAENFVSSLSFKLTNAQRRAAWDILKDIEQDRPMNRLLEGDVGSGKTLVAALAGLMAVHRGKQVVFVAPTEILAQQHFETVQDLLRNSDISVELLAGSLTAAEKKAVKTRLKNHKIDIVVGTHALLEENVEFASLGLAIVDEQHRFGVKQRQQLQQKANGVMPHLLSMTATPIPRTLALTVFGELDVSVIDELPPGRKKVHTKLVSPNSRQAMYDKITQELEAGRQAFVVYPLIEDSEALQINSLQSWFDKLQKKYFKNFRVGLLHGKLKQADKATTMQQFVDGSLDILAATTVVEVGVDVPNASCIVIESAERFGLAQLHQLRGRVGRSQHQSYCFLVTTSSQKPPQRLLQFETVSDGFKLAELDLELRGPGEIYGALQHGALDLRIAKLSDVKLIRQAQTAVKTLANSDFELLKYPSLNQRIIKLKALTYLN